MSEQGNQFETSGAADRDADTIARLLGGDPEGLRQLFEDHGGVVRSRLRQTFGKMLDASELDEVLSLTSIRVWHAAARFDPAVGKLRAWVSVIARNCAIRLLEARHRYRSREDARDLDQLPAPEPEPLAPASARRQKLLADTLACVRNLPRLQRAILMADLAAGGTVDAEQLAKRLRTSANAVYVSRHRGRRALRKALIALGHPPQELTDKGPEDTLELGAEPG